MKGNEASFARYREIVVGSIEESKNVGLPFANEGLASVELLMTNFNGTFLGVGEVSWL